MLKGLNNLDKRGKGKFILLFLLLLGLLPVMLFAQGASEPSGYVVSGENVYWEKTGFGKMEAPAFCNGLTECEIQLKVRSDLSTQQMDCALVSSEGTFSSHQVSLWESFAHTVSQSTYTNESKNYACPSTNYSTSGNVFYCYADNASNGNLILSHTFESISGNTITWTETKASGSTSVQTSYPDWNPKSTTLSTANGKEYAMASFNANQGQEYQLKWKVKSNLQQTSSGWGHNLKYSLLCKQGSSTLSNALSTSNYIELDPWWNVSFNYVQNYSFLNRNGSSLDLIPVCETYNTSNWFEVPYNDSIRFADEAGTEIESEIFNITQNDLGRVRQFTGCFVANFTPNQNRTIGIYYDTVSKGNANYAPLARKNDSVTIAINNTGFFQMSLLKGLGGVSSLVDMNNLEYRYPPLLGHFYHFDGGVQQGEAGTTGAQCRIAENGTIRLKVECTYATFSTFQNFTFYKGSSFYEVEIGKNDGANWSFNQIIQAVNLGEIAGNATDLDWPRIAGSRFTDGLDLQNHLYSIANNKTNTTFLQAWGSNTTINHRQDFDYGIAGSNHFVYGKNGGDQTIPPSVKSVLIFAGFVTTTQTPDANTTTWKDTAAYYYLQHTPIQVAKQQSATLNTTNISEATARTQIQSSIMASLPLATIYTDQQIYVRYLNGTQTLRTFDKVAAYGNQRWAFNFFSNSDTLYARMPDLSPTLYIWENTSLSESQINSQITALISSTLAS